MTSADLVPVADPAPGAAEPTGQTAGDGGGHPTRARSVEAYGVRSIPDAQRTSRPRDFMWIWHSAQFSFGTVVLGALPVVLGLSWWSSVTAILVGTAIGTVLMAPVVRFGVRTGTNGPVSSAAHFGVRGRVIANLITIGVGLGFFAITVWIGGTAVMVAGARLVGTPSGSAPLAIAMLVIAVAVILIAVFGHEMLIATYKITTVVGGVVLLACVVVLAPRFDAGYPGGPLALGSYWPTWLQATSIAASIPLSYATFQGDYSRYMPASTSDRSVVGWNAAGMFLSGTVGLLVGAMVTTMFTDLDVPWIQALTDVVPGWFVVVVVVFAIVGAFPQGGLCVYAAGLSANSLFWRASRPLVTLGVSGLALVVLYVGAVAYDAMDAISAFLSLLVVVVGPWTAIMSVGYVLRRGRYDPRELHRPGRYWFSGGFNLRALAAFVPSSVAGLLSVQGGLYTGPMVALTRGIDISFLVSFASAALLYHLLCRVFPERGAWLSPTVAGAGGPAGHPRVAGSLTG